MFIGREKELNDLDKMYQSDTFEFMVIYGRRRVGKTTLINEFIKDKKAVFYPGIDSNEKQNLELFSNSILSAVSDMEINTIFSSFNDAFEYIFQISKDERIVLVIDEYPYLANCYKGISSLLASFIDHKFINSKLMIILCGSSLSFMENQVLGYQSPLYGRRTGQMKILPFSFAECAKYYKKFSKYDLVLAYGITGGIPLYMSKLDDNKSIEDNIKNNFFDTSAYLFEEPGNLIKQECREPMQYNAIIKSIATGATKMGEISVTSGLNDTGAVSNYISKLISLGIVEKEFPYKSKNNKKTIYKLSDTMFQFWYRFVPANMALIGRGAKERVYERVKTQIMAYAGFVFEEICKQYLWQENLNGNLPIDFTDMGRWWGNDPVKKTQTEIDIIADNEENEAIFAECKWRNENVGEAELKDLQHQSTLFHYKRNVLVLFSKSGFTDGCRKLAEEIGDVLLISYNDMEWK
ncbi:MAG: AAA family ATPase [Lachnospiraceae bacterium]|nr:AAA family ATPase [Lachnospiraceae bacterium]